MMVNHVAEVCGGLYHLVLCKCTLRCSHNDEITKDAILRMYPHLKQCMTALVANSHRHFPFLTSCHWWTDPGSYYDDKMHPSENHQGTLEKQGLLFTSPRGYKAPPGPHSQVTDKKRERMRMDLGFCCYWT